MSIDEPPRPDDPIAALRAEMAKEPPDGTGTRDIRSEIAVAAAAVLLGGALIWFAASIRAGSVPDPITSAGLPRIAGGVIVAFAGLVLVRTINRWRTDPSELLVPSEGEDDEPGHPSTFLRPVGFVAACFAWVWAMSTVGYFIATPLFMVGALWGMGVVGWKKMVFVPIGFTVLIWVLFYELLGIDLPARVHRGTAPGDRLHLTWPASTVGPSTTSSASETQRSWTSPSPH